MNHASNTQGFEPSLRVDGRVAVPGSKSEAQRVLLLAALGPGGTAVHGVLEGEDVEHLLATLADLGLGPGGPERPAPGSQRLVWGMERVPLVATGRIGVGESGTAARLWTALAGLGCLGPGPWTIAAEGTLTQRRSGALLACLERAGARLEPSEPARGDFPLLVAPPTAGPGPLILVSPASSQEVTGLLLGLALRGLPGPLEVEGSIPSRPYVELTRDVLGRFGVTVREDRPRPGVTRLSLDGRLAAPVQAVEIEPDASAAAVALAAGCLSGGRVCVPGLGPGSSQGDVRIAQHLDAFGCEAGFDDHGIWAQGQPRRGAQLDLAGEPDLAPALAAVAAAAAHLGQGPSVLRGLQTLRGKESDRIAVLATGLGLLGFGVEADSRSLSIRGSAAARQERIVLDPHGDHRMAFAFGLLGLLLPGVRVANPDCVAKSWPRFWTSLAEAADQAAP